MPEASAAQAREPVTLNFVNADIEAVTRAIGAMLERQFVVDPRVKGTITLYSEQPLTLREAYLNYLAALRGLGFTVVENGGLLKVVPEADAKLQTGTVSVGDVGARGDQIITQIFRLNHENANNLVAGAAPADQPEQHDQRQPGQQLAGHHRLRRQPAAHREDHRRDRHAGGERRRGRSRCKHAVATDLAPLVQRLADGGAGAPGAPPQAPGAARQRRR